ncbi:MAG: DUF2723 domain-containing protein [Kiritimatiellia bacterium]
MIYFLTLAPSVTLEQSGAFVVAGEHLGIGRVPGYPLWHLLARFFIFVFGFVKYHGQPNPAWGTNFMSAFFGALSCGLVALLVARTCRAIIPSKNNCSICAAMAASLLFALSPAMWSQSVITETHTLTLFCILLFLVSSLAWLTAQSRFTAYGLAAAFALGIAQSHFVILLVPPLLLALLLARPRLCRVFCIAAAFLWILPFVLFNMDLAKSWLIAALALSGFIGIAWPLRLSSFGKTALGMIFIISAGMLFYAYLPLASLGNPPMQFGYAQTWEGFVHVITRGQYERIGLANVFSLQFLGQLGMYIRLLSQQYFLPFLLIGFLPLLRISRFRGIWLKWWSVCLLAYFMLSAVAMMGANPRGDVLTLFAVRVLFIPSFAIWGIFSGIGLAMVLDWIGGKIIMSD